MAAEIKTGTYEGTGAAINIELGWVPDSLEIFNTEDGDIKWDWFNGMTAGHAIQQINVVDSGTSGAAGMSRITANGVTAYEPTDYTNNPGFTVGTALSESGKTFHYRAHRNGDY